MQILDITYKPYVRGVYLSLIYPYRYLEAAKASAKVQKVIRKPNLKSEDTRVDSDIAVVGFIRVDAFKYTHTGYAKAPQVNINNPGYLQQQEYPSLTSDISIVSFNRIDAYVYTQTGYAKSPQVGINNPSYLQQKEYTSVTSDISVVNFSRINTAVVIDADSEAAMVESRINRVIRS